MAFLGKTMLIVNPASKSGAGAESGERAERLLRSRIGQHLDSLDMRCTECPRHAIEIASQCGGYDTVIALGGDGVIHETASGLMRIEPDKRPAFGIIPVGSGNDYARTLNMPRPIEEAVDALFEAKVKPVDVGCCNGEFFVETLSFGLDAGIALDTVERRKRTTKTDTALYFESGINQLFHHFDSYRYSMSLDDGPRVEGAMLMFAVQIGRTYGGGFRVTPHAEIDDGLFELCICDDGISLPNAVITFAKAKDGKHVGSKHIKFYSASTIELEFDRRPPCQMDGEEHIADSYSITIDRRALRVLING